MTTQHRHKGLRIAVLANTRSGKGRYQRQKFDKKFAQIIKDIHDSAQCANELTLYITANLNEIITAGKNIQQQKTDIIAIFGGDGAIQKTITRLATAYQDEPLPPIVLLRGGTMNNVARSFAAKGSPDKRLRLFAQNAKSDNLQKFPRATMDINGELGFMYGFGLPARFIEMYDEAGAGPLNALKMIFVVIFSAIFHGKTAQRLFAPLYGQFTIDGKKMPFQRAFGLLAETIPNLALGFQITYRALEALDQGKTAHAILANVRPLRLITKIFHILLRKPFSSPNLVNDIVTKVIYEPEQPFAYMLDGDIFQHTDPTRPLAMTKGPTIDFIWYK